MSIELKIKSKVLAAEAKIIALEESRAKKRGKTELLTELHQHRIEVVRKAARTTHLARGFMRGLRYRQIEKKTRKSVPNRTEVLKLLERYGNPNFRTETSREERVKQLNQWFDQLEQ